MAEERLEADLDDAGGTAEDADDRDVDFEEGRYIFCVVRPEGDPAEASFSAEGIDGREVRLVVAGDLAAVTQSCESLYDASDPETVRRWLLSHQSVVDAAGEAFGTPLPFRFDTVIVGDEERVREWLSENAERIHDALADLAGRWEYRIEVGVEDEAEMAAVEEEDDQLASLAEEIEAADEGRAFLLEKQYDERLRALRRERREARTEDLIARVEPHAERVRRNEAAAPSAAVVGDAGGEGSSATSEDESGGPASAASLTVLATPDAAEEIGEELEAVADEPGVEVRYTGPWPPYTFAPEIGAGEDG